jgi:hypothetical protein
VIVVNDAPVYNVLPLADMSIFPGESTTMVVAILYRLRVAYCHLIYNFISNAFTVWNSGMNRFEINPTSQSQVGDYTCKVRLMMGKRRLPILFYQSS